MSAKKVLTHPCTYTKLQFLSHNKQTHTQTHTHTHTKRGARKQASKQTRKQADRQTGRQPDCQTNRQSDTQTNRQTGRQPHCHTSRQPDNQTTRQLDKQAGRQTDRQPNNQTSEQLNDRTTKHDNCCVFVSWTLAVRFAISLTHVALRGLRPAAVQWSHWYSVARRGMPRVLLSPEGSTGIRFGATIGRYVLAPRTRASVEATFGATDEEKTRCAEIV